MKISIIGCGYWGKNLVRNFANLGVLYAVCDAKVELADNMSKTYGVPIHNVDEIANSGVSGEAKNIVESAKAGEFFNPNDDSTLVEIILKWLSSKKIMKEYGENGLKYVKNIILQKKLFINILLLFTAAYDNEGAGIMIFNGF